MAKWYTNRSPCPGRCSPQRAREPVSRRASRAPPARPRPATCPGAIPSTRGGAACRTGRRRPRPPRRPSTRRRPPPRPGGVTPVRVARVLTRDAHRGRRRAPDPVELGDQVAPLGVREARPDPAHVDEPAVVGHGEQQGPDEVRPLAVARPPPHHDDLLRLRVLELQPQRRAAARRVRPVAPLRDDALEPQPPRRLHRGLQVPVEDGRHVHRGDGVAQHVLQHLAPLVVRALRERPPAGLQDVEHHEVDRDPPPCRGDVPGLGDVRALLEAPEARPPRASSATISPSSTTGSASAGTCSASACSSGYVTVMSLPERLTSRTRPCDTCASVRNPSHFISNAHASPSCRSPADAGDASIGRQSVRAGRGSGVPSWSVRCSWSRRVAGAVLAPGLSSAPRSSALPADPPIRRLLPPPTPRPRALARTARPRRHEVDQPVVLVAAVAAARVDEREAAGAVLLAVERDDDLLAVAPLLQLVRAGVPDGHLAGPVLALRDRALERPVRERVVLGLDGEVVLLGVGRLAARQRPAHEHAVVLQPEVPVQAAGVVLLDDEAVARARRRRLVRDGLGRAPGVAHGAVPVQAVGPLVVRPAVRGAAARRRAPLRSNVAMRSGVGSSAERCPCVSAASGSPRVRTRSTTSSRSRAQVVVVELLPGAWRGDGGVLAPAQRVGRDRRLVAVVLAPVHEHLAAAQRLLHVAHDEVGVLGLEIARELVRDGGDGRRVLLAVERGVQVDALGPARHRQGVQAHALEDLPRLAGDLRALGQPGTRAGVEVEDQPVGVEVDPGTTEPPLRHVELERRRLAQPREGREVVDQHVVVGAALVLDAARAHPGRDALARVLLEEHLAVDAVGPALARRGTVGAVGSMTSATAARYARTSAFVVPVAG